MKNKIINIFLLPLVLCSCNSKNLEELYSSAIEDVIKAEQSDIRPLVCLTEEEENIIWNASKDKVLFMYFNADGANLYPKDKTISNPSMMWVASEKELSNWYKDNQNKFSHDDETLKLKFDQLIGLPTSDTCDIFTTFYISPNDVIRPAYETNPTKQMTLDFPFGTSEEYIDWFNNNMNSSYFGEVKYPWTRLGYTYNWDDVSDHYGLSEFLVCEGIEIEVVANYSMSEYCQHLLEL